MKVYNLKQLVSLSEEQIGEILDNKMFAKELYDFIHKKKEEKTSKEQKKSTFRSKRWKR